MSYALTLVFACGIGCGEPAQVTVTTPYATSQECDMAGQGWMAPNANPEGAVDHYSCASQSTILDPSIAGAPQPQPISGG
jgi:hypothetical protein